MSLKIIRAHWPAPEHVHAFSTTRVGGVSLKPFAESNFSASTGDNLQHVSKNRELLKKQFHLPVEPTWIKQIHSNIVLTASAENAGKEADATYTNQAQCICAVLTADCLPLLITNTTGTYVAAIHAGWRGLQTNIIQETVQTMNQPPATLLVWLGPAIGPNHFEVGDEVRSGFSKSDPIFKTCFEPTKSGKWLANIYSIARLQLQKLGITSVYGGEYCTYSDNENFYSYRRDGDQTGRMVSLIYFSK